MQCAWFTKPFKRCGRSTRLIFCPDHCRYAIWGVLSFLASGVLVFYGDDIKQAYRDHFSGDAQLPEFRLFSEPVQVPGKGESALSLTNIRDRRIYRLEIKNSRSGQLTHVVMNVQFPEPILEIRSRRSPSTYHLDAAENWDKQPIRVSGDLDISPSAVEPFATEEKTGLWRLIIDAIAPNEMAEIEILSTSGEEGGMYQAWASREEVVRKSKGERLWLIDGDFQYGLVTGVRQEKIVVPLEFDRENREFFSTYVKNSEEYANRVSLQHGKGARIPGILKTKGYIVSRGLSGTAYNSPFMLERLHDIDVRFGLFGAPPQQPGFMITLKKSAGSGNRESKEP